MNHNDTTPPPEDAEQTSSNGSVHREKRRAALARLAKLGYVAPVTIAMISLKAAAY
ncbi:hypothetical protein [Rhodospirillum sp. A1_3_36]|uniref:hypothetical protein n=1 Tax=Rhodospirillum sp. A1_3_36 TaxID=3391666 RepID=UPI0039A6E5CB